MTPFQPFLLFQGIRSGSGIHQYLFIMASIYIFIHIGGCAKFYVLNVA